MTPQELKTRLINLDSWIKEAQPIAVGEYVKLDGSNSLHSLHAHIGRNNNTFVNSIRTQFSGPDDFIAQWIAGLNVQLDLIKATGKRNYGGRKNSEQFLLEFLQHDFLREYVFKFLERNFYRNFRERIRAKPDEELWSLWFGGGSLAWGLVISPARRDAEWTNDKSQMRREQYDYWTVGHVMKTGLIDPTSDQPLRFGTLDDLLVFYRSVLKRVSNSLYERDVADRYIDYLTKSRRPLNEPFLIPELRYAGKEQKHEYRLDYTVLNPYSLSFVGFEFSPASTHIHLEGIKTKTQQKVNEELAGKWKNEMDKRNGYFGKFGVSIVTFTDTDLKDMSACFSKIESVLTERQAERPSIKSELSVLLEAHCQC